MLCSFSLRLKRIGRSEPAAGIAQAMETLRRRMGEAHQNRAAGGRGHVMLRRLPHNVAAVGVGQDEPGVFGHDVDGQHSVRGLAK